MRMLLLAVLMIVGCADGSSISVKPSRLDASGSAKAAMHALDSNKDGTLSEKELEASPGLQAVAKVLKQKTLSAADVQSRFATYLTGDRGLVAFGTTVKLNGQPLAGATVTFTPEPFMSGLPTASGMTDQRGQVTVTAVGQPVPGLYPGLYRVSISKQENGKELLRAVYNENSTLGHELPTPGGRGSSGDATFALTTK